VIWVYSTRSECASFWQRIFERDEEDEKKARIVTASSTTCVVTCALIGVLASFLGACHPRPVEELALADTALRAAQKSKADSLAPDAFRKAENYLLRAKKDYSEGYFDSCRSHADEARRLAEQAEYQAHRKQNQIGGVSNREFAPEGAPPVSEDEE
jgi:hypothetical protein